jgi:hypothetical protein
MVVFSTSAVCFSRFLSFSLSLSLSLSPSLTFLLSLQDSRLPSLGDADDFPDHVDGVFSDERARDGEGDDLALYEVPGAHAGKKSKHLGVLYSTSPRAYKLP